MKFLCLIGAALAIQKLDFHLKGEFDTERFEDDYVNAVKGKIKAAKKAKEDLEATYDFKRPPFFKISSYEEDRHAEDYSNASKLKEHYDKLPEEHKEQYKAESASRKRYAGDWEHVRNVPEKKKHVVEHFN